MVEVLSAIKSSLSITDQLLKVIRGYVEQCRREVAFPDKLSRFQDRVVDMSAMIARVESCHSAILADAAFASVLSTLKVRLAEAQELVEGMKNKLQQKGPSSWDRIWSTFIGTSSMEAKINGAIEALKEALQLPAERMAVQAALDAWANTIPSAQRFEEWEAYRPPQKPRASCLEHLLNSSTTNRVVVVTGMFGSGKSSLARHLACKFSQREEVAFPDGVIWLHCGEKCNIQEREDLLLAALRRTGGASSDDLDRALADKNMLLVLDDVWDPKVIQRFNVTGFHGKLLVTSQNKEIWGTAPRVALPGDDFQQIAEQLLASLAFPDGVQSGAVSVPPEYQAVAKEVLGQCSGCPLAVVIIAHCLKEYDGVGEWRRFLSVWSKSTKLYKNPAPDGCHETVYGAISLSLDALPEATMGLDALEAACLFPAGSNIPISSVFTAACTALHPASVEDSLAMILSLAQHNLVSVQRNLVQVNQLVANYMWDQRDRAKEIVAALVALLQCDNRQAQKLAVAGLINRTARRGHGYTAMNSSGIPTLIRCLGPDMSYQVVGSAAGALGNLAQGSPAHQEMISRHGGIEQLVTVLQTTPDGVRDCAAMALANLAAAGSEREIVDCNGISALLELLEPEERSVELNQPVFSTLKILAAYSPGYRAQIRAAGGMERLIKQLTPPYEFDSTHQSFSLTRAALQIAMNTLLDLASGSEDRVMGSSDVYALIALLEVDSPAGIRLGAICAVASLASGSKAYQDSIRASGGIDRLITVLGSDNPQELEHAARALARLAAGNQQNQTAIRLGSGIQALVPILGMGPAAAGAAAAALATITAGNAENQTCFGDCHGVEALLDLLQQGRPALCVVAAEALTQALCRHKGNGQRLILSGRTPALIGLLSPGTAEESQTAAAGAVAELTAWSVWEEEPLREYGIVQALAAALQAGSFLAVQESAAMALANVSNRHGSMVRELEAMQPLLDALTVSRPPGVQEMGYLALCNLYPGDATIMDIMVEKLAGDGSMQPLMHALRVQQLPLLQYMAIHMLHQLSERDSTVTKRIRESGGVQAVLDALRTDCLGQPELQQYAILALYNLCKSAADASIFGCISSNGGIEVMIGLMTPNTTATTGTLILAANILGNIAGSSASCAELITDSGGIQALEAWRLQGSTDVGAAKALSQQVSTALEILRGPTKRPHHAPWRTALLMGASAAALLALCRKCRRV